jgi:hypothetical protein
MNLLAKKILYIDLETKEHEFKLDTDLMRFVGGIGLGFKLFANNSERDAVIFSVGPLNGFFPYASKTSVVVENDGVIEDIYLGGSLSFRMRFADVDSIVLLGKAKEPLVINIDDETVTFYSADQDLDALGLPGKRSILAPMDNKLLVDRYFTTPEKFLENKLKDKNVKAMVITGSKTFKLNNPDRYEQIYKALLQRISDITVDKWFNPSCSGCPVGCNRSKIGEIGGNVLVHSLVACTFAEKIYSDVGITFSCLNVLGYPYTHEDIENLPVLINSTLKELES